MLNQCRVELVFDINIGCLVCESFLVVTLPFLPESLILYFFFYYFCGRVGRSWSFWAWFLPEVFSIFPLSASSGFFGTVFPGRRVSLVARIQNSDNFSSVYSVMPDSSQFRFLGSIWSPNMAWWSYQDYGTTNQKCCQL